MSTKKSNLKNNKNKAKTKPEKDLNLKPSKEDDVFPIVGVGASAGGLEAYTTFLRDLPLNTGMGFVLVQHQDPTHHSALTELLNKITRLPVQEVINGMRVRPNQVYVMPPNTNMHLVNGILKLHPRTEARGLHLPIDSFFQSLAEYHKVRAVGVLLSGTASDGTLGLKAIKAAGGITFAQDEKSAKYSGMPKNAVDAGVVDYVMSPGQIAVEIGKIARHPILKNHHIIEIKEPSPEQHPPHDEDLFNIFRILKKYSGVNFENYKPNTILRRISRRMLLQRVETLSDYVERLRNSPKEISALYEDILINVTSFFRDPETFDVLKEEIFPRLMSKSSPERNLRIWVPACSTGEEVYSIAICLNEFMSEQRKSIPIQVFGTDISDNAIENARAGFYSYDIQKDVRKDRLEKFFSRTDRGYQINKILRDMCIFARHNVTKDPPFSRMDIISCRNLLIYFGGVLQRKVIPVFHYALNPNGYLILGSTESIGGFDEFFFPADKRHRIFSKKIVPSRIHFDISDRTGLEQPIEREKQKPAHNFTDRDVLREGDRLILSKYAPPSVIINEDMEILQFRGKTGHYLEPAPGLASLNVIKMAKEGFAMELRNAILRAKKEESQILVKDLHTKWDGHFETFDLEVTPFSLGRSSQRFFLVSFKTLREPTPQKAPSIEKTKVSKEKDINRIRRLEQELIATKEYLESIIEEQEATNEELRAANEEILSSNEELQSTNEEMETAKEELQSSNEELRTVNDELSSKVSEIASVNNDLNNFLSSVHIPTVMVDSDLRIRRYTPMAEKALNLIVSDVGRPMTDINLDINLPNLADLIREVIDTITHKDLEIQDRRGHWYRLQIRPYKTSENKIDGAVIVLIDVDYIKRSLSDVAKYKEYCEAIVENAHESIVLLDGNLKIILANRSFYRTFHITGDVTGTSLNSLEVIWNSGELRKLLREILPENLKIQNYKVEGDFPIIGRKSLLLNVSMLSIENTGEQNILLAIEDLSKKT
jgi:two-component system CheB/CheR fusion protein